MFAKERDLLSRIAEASKAIRQKHRKLKLGRESVQQSAQEFFRPVINPIEKIIARNEKKDQLKIKEELLNEKDEMINQILQNSLMKNELLNGPFRNDDFSYGPFKKEPVNNSFKDESVKESFKKESLNDSLKSADDEVNDGDIDDEYDSDDDDKRTVVNTNNEAQMILSSDYDSDDDDKQTIVNTNNEEEQMILSSDDDENSNQAIINGAHQQPDFIPDEMDSERSEPEVMSKNIQDYLHFAAQKNIAFDLITGVRKTSDGWMIGNKSIRFDKDYLIIDKKEYKLTEGLLQLIFLKAPVTIPIDPADKEVYKQILIQTNAHMNANNNLRDDRSKKVQNIVRPLFTGKGLPRFMIEQKREIKYVYWDDPNDLVDRLRFLMDLESSTNENHSNEIMSIIEELREQKIIY